MVPLTRLLLCWRVLAICDQHTTRLRTGGCVYCPCSLLVNSFVVIAFCFVCIVVRHCLTSKSHDNIMKKHFPQKCPKVSSKCFTKFQNKIGKMFSVVTMASSGTRMRAHTSAGGRRVFRPGQRCGRPLRQEICLRHQCEVRRRPSSHALPPCVLHVPVQGEKGPAHPDGCMFHAALRPWGSPAGDVPRYNCTAPFAGDVPSCNSAPGKAPLEQNEQNELGQRHPARRRLCGDGEWYLLGP